MNDGMRCSIAPAVLAAFTVAAQAHAAAAAPLHLFRSVVIAPDGRHVASIETDDLPAETQPPARLLIRGPGGATSSIDLPCAGRPGCVPSSPTWSADGQTVAFLLDEPDGIGTDIETVAATGGTPQRALAFPGPLDSLRYGPGGQLAVLATANAHKRVGATQAAAALQGEIGVSFDEQRIAVVDHAALRFISPADLYVYEYDWRPDGGFVATAAHGNGDSNWWVARLYGFEPSGAVRTLFTPGPREQLAAPVVSPDGGSVGFIGGWMSDFGSTGGDAFLLHLKAPGAAPVDLTPGLHATVTSIDWHCGNALTATTLAAGTSAVATLAEGAAPHVLWSGERMLSAGGWNLSLSCSRLGSAAISQSFADPPELVAGPIGAWRPLTHANAGQVAPGVARSITWRNDGLDVQGWLIEPARAQGARMMRAGSGGRPMIVDVHGGPQAAATPAFPSSRGVLRGWLAQGWDVFEPNYRGSFGQGEAFAAGSIRDIGGGDWRDVLSGVDAAERAAPIDDARLGITGGSYGGYMTMWAVTKTHRFRAGVADAGVSDWLSIEGEAPQAGSDDVTFGGSVYDNPKPYLDASPIMHMRGVTTPVLVAVGERDVECPMPQSQEFFTALRALDVPASFIVYPGEGHALVRESDREDLKRRGTAWFRRWFESVQR
ncbi:alpha/beta hydrolase family protein [Lichenicoccus sp.]|uniref:alpha/beta hydrolase family protein n=1 Tax=Lichenicoccus sp. TaxID=2781899 RepID=UPI003D0BCB1C